MLEQIASIIGNLVWPVTVLGVALMFRKELRLIFTGISIGRRNLRLKYGKLELESSLVEELEGHLRKIAEEPDPEKRQALASIHAALDLSFEKLDENSKKALNWLSSNQLENSTYINWYEPPNEASRDSCKKLDQLGLIQLIPMYDGDELIKIHPLVKEYLRRKTERKNS